LWDFYLSQPNSAVPWYFEKIAANTTICGLCCTKHRNKPVFAHDHIYLSTCCT
jgi:hypothetical protein